MLKREPTLVIQAIVAALIAIDAAVLTLPAWAHTVIACLIVGLGAVANRARVTPVPPVS
jgi:hypothetical protein